MELRNCKECQQILRGRTDKRFCDDHCRNSYNNKIYSSEENLLRIINRKLRKNRKILQLLLGDEQRIKISKVKLIKAGLNFEYLTHTLMTSKGQCYIFCYEYGYLEIEPGIFLIVKNRLNTPISAMEKN
ncbi:hypothetical protein ACFRAE_01060 [Sphingobacterium sp. HJSM2_6]|uniref:hypothetical protein n=1 Tax=Sphingobacterium sp. HJSM2_6 TaxID=3366264 RepID=UPI003BC15811